MTSRIEYFLKYLVKPLSAWALLVCADQASKLLLRRMLYPGQTVPVLPFFQITYLTNTGMAFSMFQGANNVFMFFTLAVLLALGVWYARNAADIDGLSRTSVVLIASGAAGNLIDRVLYGHVTDFLDFYVGSRHWPSFNIADSCITIGGCLLFIWMVIPAEVKK